MKVFLFLGTTILSIVGIYHFNAKCRKQYGEQFNYKTYLLGLNNDMCYHTKEEHSLFDETKQEKG